MKVNNIRLCAAFLASPLITVVLVSPILALATMDDETYVETLLQVLSLTKIFATYGTLFAILIGVPMFLLVRRLAALTLPVCVLSAIVAACIPHIVVVVMMNIRDPVLSSFISFVDGTLLAFVVPGAVCGSVFWAIAFAGVPLEKRPAILSR
jgi:hypothetical protein